MPARTITGKLRDYARDFIKDPALKAYLEASCDAIDETHVEASRRDIDDALSSWSEEELRGIGLMRIPVAADGALILCGQSVYGQDRKRWDVEGYHQGKWSVVASRGHDRRLLKPAWLTHDLPVRSVAEIATEMRDYASPGASHADGEEPSVRISEWAEELEEAVR